MNRFIRTLYMMTPIAVLTSCSPPPEPAIVVDEEAPPTVADVSLAPPARFPEAWRVAGLLPETPLALADLRGQVVLIDYWSSHSLASRTTLRDLGALHLTHQDAGFTVISVNIDHQDDHDELRQRLRSLDLPYPIGVATPESARALGGLRTVPTRYLIDRDGRIRETYAGGVPLAQIEEELKRLLL